LVEQAMFFLAGLLVAGLAGVIFVPAFARRASRLSAARARMLAPLSMKEAVAERDMLRAEHAVAQHRLERRIAALQDAVGRHRADLGRQAATIVALESGTSDRRAEIAELRADLAARQRETLSLEADLGASRIALNDFGARLDRASSEIARLTDERLAIETLTDEQRSVIAGLETRASGLEMKLDDAAQAAKAKAAGAQAEWARVSSELNSRMSEAARLSAELQQARQRLAELEAAPTSRPRALEGASIDGGGRLANGATPGQAPADADNIRLDPGFGSPGDVALREAISRLAADLARLSGASGDGAALLPKPGKSKRRETRSLLPQGADPSKGPASAQVRQLRSMAPER
jgi:predicted  nucleic acid-binding Zn-ribbon protein